ncbi:MAG: hypothetical protein EP329_28805 [Deltaproteobacteria bacterium]|nr:MAG: hypothetical protein EP329_28805 [Deltaproteobacteria bacterium]
MDWKWMALTRALTVSAAILVAACGKGDAAEGPATPAPGAAKTAVAAVPSPTPADEAPVASDPRDPVVVALPSTEVELGDEPDDAPHVDRALRMTAPREGDQVIGRGFVLEGVPDDVTIYWPKGGDGENTYVIYDAGFDHVATIVEAPASVPGPARFDPASLAWTALPSFAVWPSELAAGQKKRGAGKTTRFTGPRFDYRVDRLGPLPWLAEGFAYRVDP